MHRGSGGRGWVYQDIVHERNRSRAGTTNWQGTESLQYRNTTSFVHEGEKGEEVRVEGSGGLWGHEAGLAICESRHLATRASRAFYTSCTAIRRKLPSNAIQLDC